MAYIGNLLQELNQKFKNQKSIKKKSISFDIKQKTVLKKLLKSASKTKIGKDFDFENILKSNNIQDAFAAKLPYFNYQTMYEGYWQYALKDLPNMSWPGKIKYFALTSGTSDAASKRVPVSKEMLKAIKKTSLNQSRTLLNLKLSPKFYDKSVMMLGGSTELNKVNEHFEGDLSGILVKRLPPWVQLFYKPGKDISKLSDWNQKLEEITKNANQWDVAIIAGVPSWYQLLFDRMLEYYKVESIHDIWPNLKIFFHGSVSFVPYEQSFKKYFKSDLIYLETYLASEGFLAYQGTKDEHLKLVMDNGIYFEFVEFNEQNFDENGNINQQAKALNIEEVRQNVNYAILITTCAGTWRYLIGDTIKFLDIEKAYIEITGRTKMFLSVCGEHLSVDNMNQAIKLTSEALNITINEYTVYAKANGIYFEHQWFLGIKENKHPDIAVITKTLDSFLCDLNDDYKTERKEVLKSINVSVLPLNCFYDWMKKIGKYGSQNKFPRVLKGDRLNDWLNFIENK
jgi:hypothetical protein